MKMIFLRISYIRPFHPNSGPSASSNVELKKKGNVAKKSTSGATQSKSPSVERFPPSTPQQPSTDSQSRPFFPPSGSASGTQQQVAINQQLQQRHQQQQLLQQQQRGLPASSSSSTTAAAASTPSPTWHRKKFLSHKCSRRCLGEGTDDPMQHRGCVVVGDHQLSRSYSSYCIKRIDFTFIHICAFVYTLTNDNCVFIAQVQPSPSSDLLRLGATSVETLFRQREEARQLPLSLRQENAQFGRSAKLSLHHRQSAHHRSLLLRPQRPHSVRIHSSQNLLRYQR